jgi:hypothetical protein
MQQHLDTILFSSRGRKTILIGFLLLAFLLTSLTAYAAWYTINTNDHQVDSNWANISEWDSSLACDDPNIADGYEMDAAYVTQNTDPVKKHPQENENQLHDNNNAPTPKRKCA